MLIVIDPGNEQSAYVFMRDDFTPLKFGKVPNEELFAILKESSYYEMIEGGAARYYIEMIAHYGTGMPAGKTVFDTCVFIGRLIEYLLENKAAEAKLVFRKEVAVHICGSAKAKDSNITQALVDRFAPNATNYGKGKKDSPGFFSGFAADVWQAYALGVYARDKELEE